MDGEIIRLTRDNLKGMPWHVFCYYLGLIGNYEGEPDENHYRAIELRIVNVEDEEES